MPRSLPWLQELRSGHCPQLMFFLFNLLLMLRFRWQLGLLWSFWSLPSAFLTGFAAALFDSPVRFSRREELE